MAWLSEVKNFLFYSSIMKNKHVQRLTIRQTARLVDIIDN